MHNVINRNIQISLLILSTLLGTATAAAQEDTPLIPANTPTPDAPAVTAPPPTLPPTEAADPPTPAPAPAEEAIDLPTDLYVLSNEGIVTRYGTGSAGTTTVTPLNTFVLDFGIAPSGTRLAYRTPESLIVAAIDGSSLTVVETEDPNAPSLRGRGETIAWSPQGDAVAYATLFGGRVAVSRDALFDENTVFTDLRVGAFYDLEWSDDGRYLLCAGVDEGVYWIYRREGDQMVLASALTETVDATWMEGGLLAFLPSSGGLVQMNLDEANAQTPLLPNANVRLPHALLEGNTLLLFNRATAPPETPNAGQLSLYNPETQTLDPLSQTLILLDDLRWGPGGRLLVKFERSQMTLVNPFTGTTFALPINDAVAYSWGPFLPMDAEAQ